MAALAATEVMAEDGDPAQPRSLTLMAGWREGLRQCSPMTRLVTAL